MLLLSFLIVATLHYPTLEMHERIINPPKRKKEIMREREREFDLVEERDRTILHQNSIAMRQHVAYF